MAVTARKYNPGFLTDDELVASFCVRTAEFETIVELLRECTGASNPHQIVIGPRGSGKTSLLLRIAAEVRRDSTLAASFFPVVFAEESYEVSTPGEFWLECLARLEAQAPRHEDEPDLRCTFEELRTIRDDRELADRCLGALLDFSDWEGKRLVLMVENLDMMFRDMADPDAGWRLRKVLQTEPRFVLLASATSRFDEIDNPKHALYDLFSVRTLRPLDTSECATLWQAVAGQCPRPGTIRSLQILTGGSPRLLTIVARFGAELSFRKLMESLLDLIDDHTEYFKSHLEALPAQERRVYLALAALWKPATTREIADHARLDTSKCSAQLSRLVERGAVQTAGGSARRKQYYLTERLYNIYYLLRWSRSSDRLVEALIHFMESYYSPTELMDIGARIIREAESFDAETKSLPEAALARLLELPKLADYREKLLEILTKDGAAFPGEDMSLTGAGKTPEAATIPNESSPNSFVDGANKEEGHAVGGLSDMAATPNNADQLAEALADCVELARRFSTSMSPFVRGLSEIAHAIGESAVIRIIRGSVLLWMNRTDEALTDFEKVVESFEKNEIPKNIHEAAMAHVQKGVALHRLCRHNEALISYDETVRRFGEFETPSVLNWVATALFNKGILLDRMQRPLDALVAYDDLVCRFGENEAASLHLWSENALLRKAEIELRYHRYEEAAKTASRILEQHRPASPEKRVRSHLIRAKATSEGGNTSGCEGDVEAALALLAESGSIPRENLDTLAFFGVALGPERMCELIKASPSADLLLPLATALELELGLESRVAQEVMEVADDIRRDLAKLRQAGTGGSGEEALDGAESADSERNDV